MKQLILLSVFFGFISFEVSAQEIGTIKEVEALDIDVEAPWKTNFHFTGQYDFFQRYVQ